MLSNSTTYNLDLVSQIRSDILEEVYKAAKIPRSILMRGALRPLLNKPVQRFSEFIANVDGLIKEKGFVFAAQQAILKLSDEVQAAGQEFIPRTGPVIVASNHPGTYDGFAIVSKLPRNDIKLVVSGIPFFKNLPTASNYLIFSTLDTFVRMNAIRKSIRHLEAGGMLVIFPSGRIDPDPSILPDAEKSFDKWSRSIELFIRKVPQSRLVLTITSGVLTGEFINHPFTKFFKNDHERRRIMEFMQVIKQMGLGKPVDLHPRITFDKPLSMGEIGLNGDSAGDSTIKARLQRLLQRHYADYYPNKI
jgi:hypothetical protein